MPAERWGRLLVSVWAPTRATYPVCELEAGGEDYVYLVTYHAGKARRQRCSAPNELLARHQDRGNRIVQHADGEGD